MCLVNACRIVYCPFSPRRGVPLGCGFVPFQFEGQWCGFPLVTCDRAISLLYCFDLAMTIFTYPLLIKYSLVRFIVCYDRLLPVG